MLLICNIGIIHPLLSCGSVIWYINGKVIANSVQGLNILNLNQTWAGIYECDVKLANGSLFGHAWVANITVHSKCQIRKQDNEESCE